MVLPPLIAFAATVALSLLALRLFPRWGLLDFPARYGLVRARLPYPIGIVNVVVFLGMFLWMEPVTVRGAGVVGAVLLLAMVCVIDDRRPLPPGIRLAVQILAAGIVFAAGDCVGGRICSVTNPLEGVMGGAVIELNGAVPVLAAAATIAWLMLTMNALNWFDGIPGQVNALSVVAFIIIGALAMSDRVGQPALAALAFVLAAIAAGSLLFDWPPPRAVLGDSGAMVYGFLLGILTIYAGGKVATAFLVLGVPLVDSLIVIMRRIAAGTLPSVGGRDHLHHRLLEKGWSPRSVILLFGCIGTAFGGTALFLDTAEKMVAGIALVVVMVGLWVYARR